jgi:regulation of enolase protein 1 (concanavalin A-like superfamily)
MVIPGATTYTGDKATITLNGAGTDIGSTSDHIHMLYRPLAGNGDVIARIKHQSSTFAQSKAGLMIRRSMDPAAAAASIVFSPTGQSMFLVRPNDGANTTTTLGITLSLPAWVRLQRQSGTVTGYVSRDGSAWSQVGTTTLPLSLIAYVGTVAAAPNDVSATATADNVSVNFNPLSAAAVQCCKFCPTQ